MAEIRRAPVEVGSLSQYFFKGFIHPRWLARFQPSTVGHEFKGLWNPSNSAIVTFLEW